MSAALCDDDLDLYDIQSLEAFTKRYPDIANEARIRWWIFHRKCNELGAQTCREPERQVNIVACGSADLQSAVVSIGEISRAQSGKSRTLRPPGRKGVDSRL